MAKKILTSLCSLKILKQERKKKVALEMGQINVCLNNLVANCSLVSNNRTLTSFIAMLGEDKFGNREDCSIWRQGNISVCMLVLASLSLSRVMPKEGTQ